MGIQVLKDKIKSCAEEFMHLDKSSKIEVLIEPSSPEFMIFKMHENNDTMGNLLSGYLMKHPAVEYAGYIIEHPLHHHILLKAKLKENQSLSQFQTVMQETMDTILQLLQQVEDDYESSL
jgi:DNA-directed RNA polymerase subunit L